MTEENLHALGKLMFASHESYTACGLDSDGTNLIVKLVKEIGAHNGLYGAKITGGGSGGTVAVLGLKNAADALKRSPINTKNKPVITHIFSADHPAERQILVF